MVIRFRDPFWIASLDLLRYRRQLVLAAFGAVLSAACFGAGLSMMFPVVTLLLQQQKGLPELVNTYVAQSNHPAVRHLGDWLIAHVPADPLQGFVLVMACVVACTFLGGVGRYIHSMSLFAVVQRASSQWRMRLFRRVIHAPLSDSLRANTGERVSRILFDTNSLAGGYRAIFGAAVTKLLNGAVAISIAARINWRLTLLGLVGAPAIGLLMRLLGRQIKAASGRAVKRRGQLMSILQEAVQNLRVVKSNQAEGYERRRFGFRNRQLNREEMYIRRMDALSKPLVETISIAGVAGVASIAAYYVLRRGVRAEEFITVLAMLAAAGAAMQRLLGLHNVIQECSPAAQRVLEGFELPIEPGFSTHENKLPRLPRHRQAVALDSITFSYPGQETPALRDVSINIPHGTTVAIVGANGSGKTTLISLLPRHFEPEAGRVLIDGVDISTIDLNSLRKQIAVVTQETVLFRGTVAQNIAYGQPHISRERIVVAARAALADDFIARLPAGYDTELGDKGNGLSGGEKQRICIARAVLRDPAILILDEATSQIDADSEAKINHVIRALRRGRTTFVIAHRLSTVIDADLILVMDAGRLVDRGTHDQLMKRCPAYRVLAQTQLRQGMESPATV